MGLFHLHGILFLIIVIILKSIIKFLWHKYQFLEIKGEISFMLTERQKEGRFYLPLHLNMCSLPKTSMTYFATIAEESSWCFFILS